MIKGFFNQFRSNLINIFIYAVFCILPFYLENHHYNVGEAKSHFLYGVSIAVIVLISIYGFAFLLLKREPLDKITFSKIWKDISITEKFLVVYTGIIVLSYIFSSYKADVLWGFYNWRVGLIPLVLISVMTFLIIHYWRGNRWIVAAIGSVSAIVFLLGVCNRFSIYPIMIEPMQYEFISTLGNINWFCGYLAVIAPIGIGMFVFGDYTDVTDRWKKIYLGMYASLCFVTAFCQGSDSAYLWYISLFGILLWISALNKNWLRDWLLLVIMWALAAQFVRLVKFLSDGLFNYEAHKYLINSNFTLYIAVAMTIIYVIFYSDRMIRWEMTAKITRILRCIVIAGVIVSFLLWLGASVYNTLIGIPGLEESTLFLLNEKWGSDRGTMIKISLDAWLDMPLIQKLFGCGPDAYYNYMYSIPEVATYLHTTFDDAVWTNSHCELITSLINIGLVGTLAYMGIFITFVYRCMKKGKEQPLLYIPVVCVGCYFIHNIVSFAHVINYPYLFFIMGMGECYLRKETIKS